MKLTQSSTNPLKTKTGLLAVLAFSDKKSIDDATRALPASTKTEIRHLSAQTKFEGKLKQVLTINTHGKISAPLLVIVGLGKSSQSDNQKSEAYRRVCGLVVQTAKQHKCASISIILPENRVQACLNSTAIGQACAQGLLLADYQFNKYKKPDKKEVKIKTVTFLSRSNKFKQGLKTGESIATGVILARNLVNEPPGKMLPTDILKASRMIADLSKSITLKLYSKTQLIKMKCGGILAVSQGSPHEPYLIHLTYKPQKKSTHKLALVGKGITFDSGGINLKPSDYMDNMKTDMAGAAAVLGVFSTLSTLKPDIEIHGIIPTCENMPGSNAIKPGDIIKIKNGQTVEINNTDAEGRLILADALSYAVEQKVDTLIDLATLTGACIVALGDQIAGIMGNNKKLVSQIKTASLKAGEKMWPLPLPKTYQATLKSDLADLRNLASMKSGGAITAGLFLQNFVNKIPWAHIDIAGPAYAEKPFSEYIPKGGVGFGVRTVVEFLMSNF